MQTMVPSIQWGNMPLVLDQQSFEEGYLSGPLHPETPEERTKRLAECVLIEE